MGPFMSQKILSMTSFIDHCTNNFFLIGESVFTLWTVFLAKAHSGKPRLCLFVQFFKTILFPE